MVVTKPEFLLNKLRYPQIGLMWNEHIDVFLLQSVFFQTFHNHFTKTYHGVLKNESAIHVRKIRSIVWIF